MSVSQTPIDVTSSQVSILPHGTDVTGPDGVTRSVASTSGDSYTVHGVAIGSGDITRGSSGIKKYWPEEELQLAAESLQGRPLVQDHDNSADGVVGRVVKAGFKEDVGILYEAELYSDELAEKVENGLLEVSIRGYHKSVDEMEENDDGAKVVENIQFDNLSIVPTGAAPSNSLNMGEHAELSAVELSEYIGELQEWQPGDYVQWGDNHGIILEIDEDEGAVIVDNYHQNDDGDWESTMDEEEIDSNDLEEWEVDEDDITSASGDSDDEDEEEEAESDISEGDYVQWHSGEGRVKEINEDEAVVEPYAKNDQVWEPTDFEDDVMVNDLEPWDVPSDNVSEKGHYDDEEEELSASMHEPSWSGTRESDSWESLNLSDFTEEDWDDLSEDEQSSIADHFTVSDSGFPPDSFGDLKLPVVHPSGELDLAGLRAAKSRAGQTDGVSGDMQDDIERMYNDLASENFDVDWEEENASKSYEAPSRDEYEKEYAEYLYEDREDAEARAEEIGCEGAHEMDGMWAPCDTHQEMERSLDSEENSLKVLTGDDLLPGESNEDRVSYVPIYSELSEVVTMFDEDKLEELNNPVAVEQEEIEELREKASSYEDLQEEQKTVEEMSDTLEELRDRTDILDEVDSALVEELRDSDDPIVVEESRFDELEEEAQTVKTLYADRVSEELEAFDSEELMEKYTIDELREKFEKLGGDLEEELNPAPKSTDPSEEELEEQSGEESEEAELADEVASKQEELRNKILD